MTYYILNTLTIKYGCIEQLVTVMKEHLPYMERQGWHLRGAYRPVIGDFNKITHIWELDDLECVDKMFSESSGSNPHVLKALNAFAEFLESENLRMVMKTPYSP
jgi:hypothetical protein